MKTYGRSKKVIPCDLPTPFFKLSYEPHKEECLAPTVFLNVGAARKQNKTSLVRSRLHKVLLFFIGHSTAFWVVRPPSLLSLTSLKILFFFFLNFVILFLGLLCGSAHVWGFSWPGEATASVEDIRNNRHWPTFVLLSSDVGYFGDLDDYWKCFFKCVVQRIRPERDSFQLRRNEKDNGTVRI